MLVDLAEQILGRVFTQLLVYCVDKGRHEVLVEVVHLRGIEEEVELEADARGDCDAGVMLDEEV